MSVEGIVSILNSHNNEHTCDTFYTCVSAYWAV